MKKSDLDARLKHALKKMKQRKNKPIKKHATETMKRSGGSK